MLKICTFGKLKNMPVSVFWGHVVVRYIVKKREKTPGQCFTIMISMASYNYISKTVQVTKPRPLKEAVVLCMDINHHVIKWGLARLLEVENRGYSLWSWPVGMWVRQKKIFFHQIELKPVGLVRTHKTLLSYVHNLISQPCRHCAVLFSFDAQQKKFVQSIFPISMPFTVLSVPHHCGRGASVWGRGGRWLWGGAECLTQTNAELLWYVLGTECKTVSDHANISANCWVVEPVFLWT